MKKTLSVFIIFVLCFTLYGSEWSYSYDVASNKKIVCYGDSITYGDLGGAVSASPYPSELSNILNSVFVDSNFTVINKGVCGMQSDEALINFNTSVLLEKPDIVIIMFGINDASGSILPMNTVEQYTGNIKQMVNLAKQNNVDVILCSPTPTYYKGYGQYGNKRIMQYGKTIESIARELKVKYVDNYKYINNLYSTKQYTNYELQGVDYVHFANLGYKKIAENIAIEGFDIGNYIYNVSVEKSETLPIVASPYIKSNFMSINETTFARCHRNYWVSPAYSNGTYLTFEFLNTQKDVKLNLIAPRSHYGGVIDVYDNGKLLTTVDFYAPNIIYDQVVLIDASVSMGYHKIEIDIKNARIGRSEFTSPFIYLSEFEFVKND